jgi:putative tryptophan/tyrosine transport system substrate-binding protein
MDRILIDSFEINSKSVLRNIKFATLLCAMLFVFSPSARAQQPAKIPRVGYVSGTGNANNPGPRIEAFRQGMRDLGYIEGKTIQVEYRYIEGKSERVAGLFNELIQLKVDLLVTVSFTSSVLAKKATKTIPIVMVLPEDPVATGLVDSLARPGGNITGVTILTRELSGKRVELLLEAVPGVKRVGILYAPSNTVTANRERNYEPYEIAGHALKITSQRIDVLNPSQDLDGAFRAAVKGRANAIVVLSTATVGPYRRKITELAIKNRLPLMTENGIWVDDGGLMSYAANDTESYRRIATFVDKILKGAKPSELPVEQPTKFEFAINLKTAKTLGIEIPQSVLFRADRVIR